MWFNVAGTVLIVAAMSIMIVVLWCDFYTDYRKKKQLEKKKADWLNHSWLVDTSDGEQDNDCG